MSSPSSGDAPIGDPRAHPEFERVFNDCLEELNTTGFIDPEQIAKGHPDFGPAILEDLELYIGLRPPQTHAGLGPLGTLGTLGDYTLRRQIGRGGMDFLPFWKKNLGAVTPSSGGVVRSLVVSARTGPFACPRVRP